MMALKFRSTSHMSNGIHPSHKTPIQITFSTKYPLSEIPKADVSAALFQLGTSRGVYTCYQNLVLQHRQNGQAVLFLISVMIFILTSLPIVICIE
jgi:hypothetical protein